jgi:two-component system response regulator FlrC
VVPIVVSPLRDRKEDVPLLADQFLQRFARKHGVEVHRISNECFAAFEVHAWPGNVRELQNVIERAVILCSEGGVLEPAHLGLAPKGVKAASTTENSVSEFCSLSEIEKRHILAALERSKGNRTHAARLLGISIRTLRNKLNEYNFKSPAREPVTD